MSSNLTNKINSKRYNLSSNFSQEIDLVLNGTYNNSNQVKARDYTPKILVDNGVNDLPMLMTAKHIKSTILKKEEAVEKGIIINKKSHYHGLGKEILLEVIDRLDNPLEIYKQSDNNYLIVTEFVDNEKKHIIVPIEINGKGTYNDVFIEQNQIKTVYGHNDLIGYLKYNNFKKIYKKNEITLNEGVKSHDISNSTGKNIS